MPAWLLVVPRPAPNPPPARAQDPSYTNTPRTANRSSILFTMVEIPAPVLIAPVDESGEAPPRPCGSKAATKSYKVRFSARPTTSCVYDSFRVASQQPRVLNLAAMRSASSSGPGARSELSCFFPACHALTVDALRVESSSEIRSLGRQRVPAKSLARTCEEPWSGTALHHRLVSRSQDLAWWPSVSPST